MHIHEMVLTIGGGGGVQELDVPFVVSPLRWFFCLLGGGSFHFVPCIPPCFFGCFDLFMIGRVSSHTYSLTSRQEDKKLQTTTQLSQGTQLTGHGEPAHHEGCTHPKP
jgi:hypothetical protein